MKRYILIKEAFWAERKEENMPSITVMLKPSSGICNMSCDYCFYCDETQKRQQESYGFMSEDTLKNIIRKTMINAEGTISYVYQGGEPTLRGIEFYKKAIEFQKRYNRKGIQVHNALQTNGFAINEEWCHFFAENKFLVGISIDGIREVHDAYRHDKQGGATYEKIVKATQLMDLYHVDYNILTVVNQKTVENIGKIYNEYKQRNWHYQQYIACLDPIEEDHQKAEYAISAQQYGKVMIDLFELWYQDWKKNRQPYIRQFENYIMMLMGYPAEACDQRGRCGIQYVIEADGGVYPCDFYMLDKYRLGNLNHNRMAELDEKRKEIKFIDESLKLPPECKSCPHYYLCRGGCRRHRDPVENADYYRNYFCEGYRMFFENCSARLMEIAKFRKGQVKL